MLCILCILLEFHYQKFLCKEKKYQYRTYYDFCMNYDFSGIWKKKVSLQEKNCFVLYILGFSKVIRAPKILRKNFYFDRSFRSYYYFEQEIPSTNRSNCCGLRAKLGQKWPIGATTKNIKLLSDKTLFSTFLPEFYL